MYQCNWMFWERIDYINEHAIDSVTCILVCYLSLKDSVFTNLSNLKEYFERVDFISNHVV